jgi:hypothetical protein
VIGHVVVSIITVTVLLGVILLKCMLIFKDFLASIDLYCSHVYVCGMDVL